MISFLMTVCIVALFFAVTITDEFPKAQRLAWQITGVSLIVTIIAMVTL